MNITYLIHFYSDWHCGSGLSSGADIDSLVIKDDDGLPFIPGKTIRGLVREAVEDVLLFSEKGKSSELTELFSGLYETNQVGCFFSNACLPNTNRQAIIEMGTTKFMYRSHSSTAIDDKNIAKKGTLRRIQTTIPCELVGEIQNVPAEWVKDFQDGLKYIKRLGSQRNRGLGRCQFILSEKGGNQ